MPKSLQLFEKLKEKVDRKDGRKVEGIFNYLFGPLFSGKLKERFDGKLKGFSTFLFEKTINLSDAKKPSTFRKVEGKVDRKDGRKVEGIFNYFRSTSFRKVEGKVGWQVEGILSFYF